MNADAKIIKWVDSNGVTHYGDKPPMPDASKQSSVLNKDGVTIKKIDQKVVNPEAEKISSEQARKDAALLASYNSAEEIDIARDRNTKIDNFALQSLQQKLSHQKQQLIELNTTIVNLLKKKRPIPADIIQQKQKLTSEIPTTQKQIDAKKVDIKAIEQRYIDDKLRYVELKPRNRALSEIKNKEKSLAELEKWRLDAQRRVEYYQNESVNYKRSRDTIPQTTKDNLLSATQELARANEEILATQQIIKRNQEVFSQKEKGK